MSAPPGAGSPTVLPAADRVLERTVTLCAVPAPPLHEQERAAVVRGWWEADGLRDVHVDETGNVWGRLREGEPGRPALVVAAHLDTVFGRDVAHGARREGTRLVGPGVGDDSIAVAALSAIADLIPTLRHPVWVLATVGEEGLGNLAGITAALRRPAPGCHVGAVIALEGNYLGRVTTVAVGSVRWRVTVRGPGGHAWEQSEAPSAVHAAAGLVTRLAALERPAAARTALNVGVLAGGESINARARHCTFDVDLRADGPDALDALASSARATLTVTDPLELTVSELGLRPAGRLPADHPLALVAMAALAAVGVTPVLAAASTDANAAYAAGVPAVTIGVTTGDGTHTEQEWIDIPPLTAGLAALADTIVRFDQEAW